MCLCLDLGEERGKFSRPEPATGAQSASRSSKVTSRARTQDAGSDRGLAQSRVSCWSAVTGCRLADGPLQTSAASARAIQVRPCDEFQDRGQSRQISAAIIRRPRTSKNGSRAQSHASVDTGGIPATAPDITKLAVGEFCQDLAWPIPLESGPRCEPRVPALQLRATPTSIL